MAETNGNVIELVSTDGITITHIEVKKESPTIKSQTESDTTSPTKVKSENGTPAATKTVKRENVSNGEPPSTLEKQLIRQVEYYFGDVNLPRDKFLLEQVKLDDGWVPLETMFKFKRLASLSTDPEVVIGALAKSTEQLMEVSEDGAKIRRTPAKPLPIMNEERKKELTSRTVYVKGFPREGVTLDDVLAHFALYGPVENIHMRSFKDRSTGQQVYKGSVFALFKTVEEAKKFVGLESVKYKETELIRKWQSDYHEDKRKEREEKKSNKGKGGDPPSKEGGGGGGPPETALPLGSVLHFRGLAERNDVTRERIKSQLVKLGAEVAFIDFNKGDTELWVRFHKENSAKNLLAEHMSDTPYKLCDCDVEVRLLEGEEEEKFLAKTKQDIANNQRNQGRHRGHQRGRGRGGRGGSRGRGGRGGQKRRGSPNRSDERASKKQAV